MESLSENGKGISFLDDGSDGEKSLDEQAASICSQAMGCEVDVTGCEMFVCKLCGVSCTADTPFTSAAMIQKTGRYRPWYKYKTIKHPTTRHIITKQPQGYQCGVCSNTFVSLGLNAQYESLAKFQRDISLPGKQQEGPKFIRATKNWIAQHNKNPDRVKLKCKAELLESFTTVDTVENMGDQDSGPLKQFVTVENWDDKKDGKLDVAKVVEEMFFGKKRKGCWQAVGREGVFTRKPIATKLLETRCRESDGQGPFAAKREQAIQDVYIGGRDAATKAVEQVIVERPTPTTMDDLMEMLRASGVGSVSSSLSAQEGDTDKQNADESGADAEEDTEEDESSEEEACPKRRNTTSSRRILTYDPYN